MVCGPALIAQGTAEEAGLLRYAADVIFAEIAQSPSPADFAVALSVLEVSHDRVADRAAAVFHTPTDAAGRDPAAPAPCEGGAMACVGGLGAGPLGGHRRHAFHCRCDTPPPRTILSPPVPPSPFAPKCVHPPPPPSDVVERPYTAGGRGGGGVTAAAEERPRAPAEGRRRPGA